MREHTYAEYASLGERKLSVLPLVFLIFYEVSGLPFGVEDSVRAVVFKIIASTTQLRLMLHAG
ncbi:hypothetical protein RJ639_017712 [Escallonia herrerae]|uniref:Uncharacterized protein n=1 Tax=Escallonia herrerae TaxID=1293975 RepID=A0AA89ALA5_9ASTE|nr:hypothetical protein RJ639_017712 [Escallonia herrerae]